MAENLWNLAKHMNTQIQEAEWTPNKIKPNIIIKLLKNRDKNSWKKPEKNNIYKGQLFDDSRFLIINHWSQKELAQYFSSAERKYLST